MAIPVSIDDARRQLRLGDDDSQDVELEGFIADAAAWVERYTGLVLEAREVTEQVAFGVRLSLRAWPVKPGAAMTVSYSTGIDQIAVTGARLDLALRPARVLPAIGTAWPSAMSGAAVTVTVRAGYEDDDVVPGNIKRAMLVLIGAYDADREGGEVFAAAEASAKSLCRYFRVNRL